MSGCYTYILEEPVGTCRNRSCRRPCRNTSNTHPILSSVCRSSIYPISVRGRKSAYCVGSCKPANITTDPRLVFLLSKCLKCAEALVVAEDIVLESLSLSFVDRHALVPGIITGSVARVSGVPGVSRWEIPGRRWTVIGSAAVNVWVRGRVVPTVGIIVAATRRVVVHGRASGRRGSVSRALLVVVAARASLAVSIAVPGLPSRAVPTGRAAPLVLITSRRIWAPSRGTGTASRLPSWNIRLGIGDACDHLVLELATIELPQGSGEVLGGLKFDEA